MADGPRVPDAAPTAGDGAPPPTPPDAVPTTVEELPAGFWDDDGPSAEPPAIAAVRDAQAEEGASPRAVQAPAPLRTTTSPPATAHTTGSPPALASLQGLALLQAVFPGRVVKVERAATATADGDAVPDEAAVADPIEAPDDEPEPGADAPLPRTP